MDAGGVVVEPDVLLAEPEVDPAPEDPDEDPDEEPVLVPDGPGRKRMGASMMKPESWIYCRSLSYRAPVERSSIFIMQFI